MTIEEQLRRAERLSTLGEMAAVLAHEIRNPLGSIRGTAEILKDDYPPGTPKHEFLEIQVRETERLNRVVEDFLQMARQQPSEPHPCLLQEELETVVTLVSVEARNRDVRLVCDLPPGDILVRGEGEKLRQAFLNIVMNALQATPPGGCVTVAAALGEPGSCGITVHDTGQGIGPEAAERIFEPFFTTRPRGTGLGLAITRKIVEAHGGTIAVESGAGRGTAVTVRLPLLESGGGGGA